MIVRPPHKRYNTNQILKNLRPSPTYQINKKTPLEPKKPSIISRLPQ